MTSPTLATITAAFAILLVSCTEGGAASGDAQGPSPTATIPQPSLPRSLPTASDTQRVDLTVPTFTHPTDVTNPLFPVSEQASVVFVGHVDHLPFRTEVTLLPYTRVVDWEGQQIETLVSQYMAYLDGRLQEVAYDLYAQADDGSVWYFGEDVVDLAHGDIVTKEGTWLAGKDGPAQMIMPADPQVGDAFRTENIPGIAFEEVTVLQVDRTLRGPLGPIPGGMVGQELHMDGGTEHKLFAPGYGEFFTGSGGDVEALALEVPTDAATSPMPKGLATILEGASSLFDEAAAGRWRAAAATSAKMRAAWATVPSADLPRLIVPRMSRALGELGAAVRARRTIAAGQAAIETMQRDLDIELRYRPVDAIDLARFDLWAQQLQLDAAAHDAAAVNGDVFTLFYIRDRLLGMLTSSDRTAVDVAIDRLQVAGAAGNIARAARAAGELRDAIAQISVPA